MNSRLDSNLAEATIYHEFQIYLMRFKEMLNKKLTVDRLMDVSATQYNSFIRRSELKDNMITDVNEISRAFISSDGEFGFTIGKGQKSKHFEVDEFKFITSAEIYEEVFKKLNNGEIKIEQDKASIGTLTYFDVLRKKDKGKQKN